MHPQQFGMKAHQQRRLSVPTQLNVKQLTSHYYVFQGRVTLFFADNFSTECRITMEFLHNFFLDPEVIFNSHVMFINAFTKEFTLVNNVFPIHDVAFEHLLYYKMVANVY